MTFSDDAKRNFHFAELRDKKLDTDKHLKVSESNSKTESILTPNSLTMTTELINAEAEKQTQMASHHELQNSSAATIDSLSDLISDAKLDGHINEIVATLGGMDSILSEYIRITKQYEDEELLNSEQIQSISDLITADTDSDTAQENIAGRRETDWDKIYHTAKLRDDTFHLNRYDTPLHSISRFICCNERVADRLIQFLFSKMLIFCIFMIAVPWMIVISIEGSYNWRIHDRNWFFIPEMVYLSFLMLYFTLLICSCNTSVILLVFSEFDQWIKLYYAVGSGVANALYTRCLD